MLKAGEKAPAFKLNDQNGRPVSLSDFAGRLSCIFIPRTISPAVQDKPVPLRDFTENFRKGMWR